MADKNVLDTLYERGFIGQTVYEEDMRKLLGSESVPFYVGFDPTADSLHIALHSRNGYGAHAEGGAQTHRAHRRRHGYDRRPFGQNGYAQYDDKGNDSA